MRYDWGKIKENRNKENNGKEDCSEQESSKKASRYMTAYAYQMDQPSTHKKADIYVMGVSELCALPDGQLLVLEREAFVPKIKIGAFCKCKLYLINPLNSEEFALKEKFSSDTPFLKKRLLAEWKTGLSLSKRPLPITKVCVWDPSWKMVPRLSSCCLIRRINMRSIERLVQRRLSSERNKVLML